MIVKADLQIHTVCSDGKQDGSTVVRAALLRGIRVLGITDHNTFRGYNLVMKTVAEMGAGIIVVPGNEVRTELGDIIVLCYQPLDDDEVPRSSGELIDYARSNNCFTYAPHPYDFKRLGIGDNVYRVDLHGIEVFNPRAGWIANMKARRAAKDLNKVMLSNSDAHTPGFIGSVFNLVDIEDFSLDSVMESLFKGYVKPVARYPSLKTYGEWIISKISRKRQSYSEQCI